MEGEGDDESWMLVDQQQLEEELQGQPDNAQAESKQSGVKPSVEAADLAEAVKVRALAAGACALACTVRSCESKAQHSWLMMGSRFQQAHLLCLVALRSEDVA